MYKEILSIITEMVADEELAIDLSLAQVETLAESISFMVCETIEEREAILKEKIREAIENI